MSADRSETIPLNDMTAPLIAENSELRREINRRGATINRARTLIEQGNPVSAALLLERERPRYVA